MVVAGTGAGSETDTWPVVLNEVLGTKFKLVTGYLGSQETIIAIERNEAHGRCVFSLLLAQDRQARLAARQEDQRAPAHRRSETSRTFATFPRWSTSSARPRTGNCSS